MGRVGAALIWIGLVAAIALPIAVAATSPLLAWRQPVYIAAGLAGVIALALTLIQPMLARGDLPGLTGLRGRRGHRIVGAALVGAVAVHVAGLWLTSPPDVIDALLFTSPTPFSVWGVAAMWALIVAAAVAGLRGRLRPRVWRVAHMSAAATAVLTGAAHAMLVEGTMGLVSKTALCALAVGATVFAVARARAWRTPIRRGRGA